MRQPFRIRPLQQRLFRWSFAVFCSLNCLQTAHLTAAELGMGLRVGEVFQNSAVVWTRITAHQGRNWDGVSALPLRGGRQPDPNPSPEELPISDREGAMPGAPGEVRLLLRTGDSEQPVQQTTWVRVAAEGDFVHQFQLSNLTPGTTYSVTVEARSDENTAATAPAQALGTFTTLQPKSVWQDVSIGVITGMMYKDLDHREGFEIFPAMQRSGVDYLVPTGDTVYYDNEPPRATTLELARYHWHRMYSLPRHIEFHRSIPGYWEVDDHDAYCDDCWPSMNAPFMHPLTFEQGFATFREQVPLAQNPTHRTLRFGKGLQVWLVEGRLYRSPNNAPHGPEKTIWGKEQRDWLLQSILESDADFKVLISPTPIVGPDRSRKSDNHANDAFRYEGNLFRNWTAEHKLDNFFVCCGDRHWQYVSIDSATRLREFSCGPASDAHAGGTPGQNSEIQPFHRVKGGFLTVNLIQENGQPTIAFRHHAVDGEVMHEYRQLGQTRPD